MDRKSSVMKSKSSNSAITTKSDRSKKTRSHPGFPQTTLRKVGVYVEKKNAKGNLNPADNKGSIKRINRPPPRPKRGQKKFLASILTILSKNTASTQYPDASNTPITTEQDKPTRIKKSRPLTIETTDQSTQGALRKKKKSRVLNGIFRPDNKKVVILQSKRDVTNTPSNISQASHKEMVEPKYFHLPSLANNDNDDDNIMKNLITKNKSSLKKKNILILNDPVTLVSENSQKDEKGLYNFFVDLLETTFSVYNVKADYDAARTPAESKLTLEIDESVANKLDVTKNNDEEKLDPDACAHKFYCFKDDEINRPKSSNVSSKPDTIRRRYKRNLKSESFFYTKQLKTDSQKTPSEDMNKKSSHKRNRKRTFINMLKEQLRMDNDTHNEPDDMHQALKIIARNKRRTLRSIHFADDVTKTDDSDYGHPKPVCVFKRRKVISSSTKSSKRNATNLVKNFRTDTISRKFSDTTGYSKMLPKSGYSTEDELTESCHSLEVHVYDFEASPRKRMMENFKKKIVFATPSSDCISENFSPNSSILKFSDSLSDSLQYGVETCGFGIPIKTFDCD